MNLVGIITRDEAKLLISKETGRTVVGDGEIIQLYDLDLSDIKGAPDPDVMYFGDFLYGDTSSLTLEILKESYIKTAAENKATINYAPFNPPAQYKNIMWNNPQSAGSTAGITIFSGYKFTLKKTWDVQELGSFANGAGWAIASGINVHSTGTTEATYGLTSGAKKFRLTIDWSGITAGSCSIETSAVVIGTVTADGIQVFEWDGDETDTSIFLIPTTDFDGGYDTTTIKLEALNKH